MTATAHSFDVFDTLLVRTWAMPGDLFHALAERLTALNLCKISAADWRLLREACEREARRGVVSGEVTLAQIYSTLTPHMGWSTEQAAQAMAVELEMELASLNPVPEMALTVQQLHDRGASVSFLSDMYLPAAVIQQSLIEHGIWQPGDRLYVSSECGANKASGRLFHRYLTDQNVVAATLTHTGDNRHSDVAVPGQLGINAVHFDAAHLNRYELLLADAGQLSVIFRSQLAGACRISRLKNPEQTAHRRAIWNASVNVVAPVLFGFVHWCLAQAQARNIRRLYFVARDGQILQRMAAAICETWKIDIECRYLYGSRQAWHFPAVTTLDEEVMEWILDPTHFLSVRSVCERVHLLPEQIQECLQTHGFEPKDNEANLDASARTALRAVFADSTVQKLIIDKAAEFRTRAIGYFEQEGLTDDLKFAIVDIGWHGRLQRSLSRLLASAGHYPEHGLTGLYFGLSKRVVASPQDELLAYFSDVDNPMSRDELCHRAILEIFVAADHGSTVSFERENLSWRPKFRSERNHRACDWGLDAQQAAILAFTRQFVHQMAATDLKPQALAVASEIVLREFLHNPSSAEAASYGSFSFSEDQTEAIGHELAPRYGLRDVARWILYRRQPHHNAWLYASIARSHALVRWLLTSRVVDALARTLRPRMQ